MIVGMVDDRAMRFRQQGTSPAPGQPRSLSSFSQPVVQPPQPVAPTRSPLNSMGTLLRAVNPLARRNDVSSSLMGPTATMLGADVAPFTTGAIAERGSAGLGDVAKDLGMYAVGGVAGKLIGSGIIAAVPYLRQAAYASNSPAVRETLGGRHFGPANLSVVHPRDVPVVDARTGGPGTYFATPSSANSLRLRLPGDRSGEYGVPLSFMDRVKLANSQGYAGPDDVAKAVSDLGLEGNLPLSQSRVPLNEAGFDNPIVQDLLRKGFVGFNPGKDGFPTGEFTNWLVGAKDIARINPRLPQLGLQSGPADVNSISRIESILRRLVPPQ